MPETVRKEVTILRVIGYKRVKFTTKDGTEIDGISLYLGEPIPSNLGEGESVDRIFFSAEKLRNFSYRPQLDDEIEVFYNRYGKPYLIQQITVE